MKLKRAAGMAVLFLCLAGGGRPQSLNPGVQEPARKPPTDYMSTFLSRNTKALGLKENKDLTRMMKQSSIDWAVRSTARHLLD
jgi:hypothetical protein